MNKYGFIKKVKVIDMGCLIIFLVVVLFGVWEMWTGGMNLRDVAIFLILPAVLFGWVIGVFDVFRSGPDTPFICPLNGKECNEYCAWYDGEENICKLPKKNYRG